MKQEETPAKDPNQTPQKSPKGKYILLVGLLLIGVGCFAAYRPNINPTVKVGDKAIDWQFSLSDTEESSLAKLWKQGPIVVIWLRHYG
jgi:hypothetical protein